MGRYERLAYVYIGVSACITLAAILFEIDLGPLWLWVFVSPISFMLAAFFPFPFSPEWFVEIVICAALLSGAVRVVSLGLRRIGKGFEE